MAITIDKSSLSFPVSGGEASLTVTSDYSDWTTTGSGWAVVSPAAGTSGSWIVEIAVGENTGGIRYGVVRFANETDYVDLAITQSAAVGTISVSPLDLILDNKASTNRISVTASADWSIESSVTWISFSSTVGGSGSTDINLLALMNSTTVARTATVKFYLTSDSNVYQYISVTQTAGSGYITVDPSDAHFTSPASSKSVTLNTNDAWQSIITGDFITLDVSAGSSGTYKINVSVSDNTSGADRVGNVRFYHISDDTVFYDFEVSQSVASSVNISVTPNYVNLEAIDSSGILSVQADAAWSATITQSGNWLSLSKTTGSSGLSSTIATAIANTTSASRTATVRFYITGNTSIYQVLTVVQAPTPQISIEPNEIMLVSDMSAGSVMLTANGAWNTQVLSGDFFYPMSVAGTGNANVSIHARANESIKEREGVIRFFSSVNNSIYADLRVVQEGALPVISIDPSSVFFDYKGEAKFLSLISNASWTSEILSGKEFISLAVTSGLEGTHNIEVLASENKTDSKRFASVRFYNSVDSNVYADLLIVQSYEGIIEQDGIEIITPKFGFAFNPIIANCVNPNNVKINALISPVTIAGDYYTFTSADAASTQNGYYASAGGFTQDKDYTTYNMNVSISKGKQFKWTGLIDRELYFGFLYGHNLFSWVKLSGASLNPLTNWEFTLPAGTERIVITTKKGSPFVVNTGTFEATQAPSNLAFQISQIGYRGETKFDLSKMTQLLFDRDEFRRVEKIDNVLYKHMRVSFSYTLGSRIIPIGNANIGIIWGGLQIGETYNQNRTYRYFKRYPFTIPLYLEEKAVLTTDFEPTVNLISNSKAAISVGGSGSSTGEAIVITSLYADLISGKTYTFHCQTDGVWGEEGNTVEAYLLLNGQYTTYFHMNTNPRVFTVGVTGRYFLRLDSNANIAHSFWQFQIEEGNTATSWRPRSESETLDPGKYNLDVSELFYDELRSLRMTTPSGIEINIEVCDCCLGNKYLRYINHRGEWNYYLWKQTSESIESESSDIVFEQYYDTVNYVNNHHAGTGQYIGKQGKKILNLAAVNLNQDMYDFVKEITLSPIVDLYMGDNNWMRVTVEDADLIKNNRVLQHLEISISLPNEITQLL